IDRLLGIPDEIEAQRARLFPFSSRVDPPEDVVLNGVGVLELVDQDRREAVPDGPSQGFAQGAGEGVAQTEKQAIEGLGVSVAVLPEQASLDLDGETPTQVGAELSGGEGHAA